MTYEFRRLYSSQLYMRWIYPKDGSTTSQNSKIPVEKSLKYVRSPSKFFGVWTKNQMKLYDGGMQLASKESIHQALVWPVRGRLQKEKYLRWLPSTTSYNLNHQHAICITDINRMAYRMSSRIYIFCTKVIHKDLQHI